MPRVMAAVHEFMRGPGCAAWRARTFQRLQWGLLIWASLYLVLVALTGHTYIRSIAFGFAAIVALWLIVGAWLSDAPRIPWPDRWLLLPILAWALWSAASIAWSIHPAFTAAELGTEVGWGLATATIFYVAVQRESGFRLMLSTAVIAAVALAGLGTLEQWGAPGGPLDNDDFRPQGGVGAFSTYLVLVIPLLPLLLAPAPTGFGPRPIIGLLALAAFAVLLMAARLTENRMFWVALAAGFVVAAILAGWRWRTKLTRAPLRWAGLLVALLILLAVLFIDAAGQRARLEHAPDATVAQALAEDPRFVLWTYTFERIRERPWLGFGFGKAILRDEMRSSLGNPMLAHAHNIFVSQWVQTGAIGLALLASMLAALVGRYALFLRARDGIQAAVGLAGIALLAAFVVKNLTDDFLVRPTSKEFWAINAMLVGYGIRRARAASTATRQEPVHPNRH
jgi:O-antigen ligase